MAATKLITLDNLTSYDVQIKNLMSTEDAKSIKTILYDTENSQIKFYKKENATLTDTPSYVVNVPGNLDGSATIATVSSGVVTLKAGITESDGVVSNNSDSDITLAKVATTGNAEDIAYDNTGSGLSATTTQAALDELAASSASGVDSKTVYITETSGGTSDPYSKRYGIYQGSTGSTSSPVVSEKLVDIDIPKDMVVESGTVVDIIFDSIYNKLYDGLDDVTEIIKGVGVTPTAADAGAYIRLIIANATSDRIYIKATDLVDIYTGSTNAETTVVVNSDNTISTTINKIDAVKIIYQTGAPATYKAVTNSDTYDPNAVYYTKSGDTYSVDSTVDASNFDSKVAAGLYIIDTPAVAEQSNVWRNSGRWSSYFSRFCRS